MKNQEALKKEIVEDLILLNRIEDKSVDYNKFLPKELIKYGLKHGVGANIYYLIKKGRITGVDQQDLIEWKKNYLHASLQFQIKFQAFLQIQKLFDENNIPLITLKGFALAISLYEEEGVRPMGDLDILVPEDKGQLALSVLLKAGAKQVHTPRSVLHEKVHSHVRAIVFNGVLIEIHQRLFSLGNPYYVPTYKCFETYKSINYHNKEINVLSDVMMGYHLICHAAYNIKNGGLRFGWLLDIALLLSRQKDIETYTEQILKMFTGTKKEMLDILMMSSVLLVSDERNKLLFGNDEYSIKELISIKMLEKDSKKLHKVNNLKEILNQPGFRNKILMTWFELFPSKEYMIEWNNHQDDFLLKLYLKRLFHIHDK
ncbi:nucleotidyltransferase family protein [Carboxylicivirga caseinilyticus]|uniref:nucleotidyltransferase family protein n=1 Tax=Carboxylicivirga caseinilyticus TaxID=3417572 RepID=UPI003D331C07